MVMTMYNIIKSLNYFIRRDVPSIVTFVFTASIPVIVIFFMIKEGFITFREVTGGMYYVGVAGDFFVFGIVAVLLLSSRIMGADAGDKTINHEILSGKKRSTVYLGRFFTGLIDGAFIMWILLMIPSFYFSIFNGWGLSVSFTDVMLRYVLIMFIYLRLSAFFLLVTSIFDGFGKGLICGFTYIELILMISSVVESLTDFRFGTLFALTNLSDIIYFENSQPMVINGVRVTRYISEISDVYIFKTVIVSIVTTIMYGFIGAYIFKRRDRK